MWMFPFSQHISTDGCRQLLCKRERLHDHDQIIHSLITDFRELMKSAKVRGLDDKSKGKRMLSIGQW